MAVVQAGNHPAEIALQDFLLPGAERARRADATVDRGQGMLADGGFGTRRDMRGDLLGGERQPACHEPPGERDEQQEGTERVGPPALEPLDQGLHPVAAGEEQRDRCRLGAQLRAAGQAQDARRARDRRVRIDIGKRNLELHARADDVQPAIEDAHPYRASQRAAPVVISRVERRHSATSKSKTSAISWPAAPTCAASASMKPASGPAAMTVNLRAR